MENLIPVVYVALDGIKGYCIPISTAQEIKEFAEDVVSGDFDHLEDNDPVTYNAVGRVGEFVHKRSLQNILYIWADGIKSNTALFHPGLYDGNNPHTDRYTLKITDADGRELSFIPGLRDQAEVEALEEFMGW